jgi:hypothetical protein
LACGGGLKPIPDTTVASAGRPSTRRSVGAIKSLQCITSSACHWQHFGCARLSYCRVWRSIFKSSRPLLPVCLDPEASQPAKKKTHLNWQHVTARRTKAALTRAVDWAAESSTPHRHSSTGCVQKSSLYTSASPASLRGQAWAEPAPRVSYPSWPTRDFGRLAPLDAQQQCIDLSAHPLTASSLHRPHTRSLLGILQTVDASL